MNVLCGNEGDRVAHAGVDIFGLQVRIEVADDPLERNPLIDQLENVLDVIRVPATCGLPKWICR
jgi:hypothetical protein